MLQKPVYFNAMRVALPIKAIYARLGFRKGMTAIRDAEKRRVEASIEEAAGIIHLRGAACVLGLVAVEKDGVELQDGTVFSSSALARMLSGCDQVLLMGASAGQDIMNAISSATRSDDLSRAVVLDAVASEMTDSGLDWIMDYMNQELTRKARRLTRARFSAGYGDFLLDNQKAMYRILGLDAIGVSITSSSILTPEKSVTAVAGVVPVKQHTQVER